MVDLKVSGKSYGSHGEKYETDEVSKMKEEAVNIKLKVIKFRDNLAKLILAGEKDSTWRLFDDKNLQKGDITKLVNSDTGEAFGMATLIDAWEKKMGDLGRVAHFGF